MNQIEKQKQFLKETIEFYNSGNRAVRGGDCIYSAISNSPGCAIGRHLTKGLADKFDSLSAAGVNISSIFIENTDLYDKIPVKLKKMDNSFLRAAQSLHDISSNWDESGLSSEGRNFIRYKFPVIYHDLIDV